MPGPTFPACYCHPALAQSECEENVPTAKNTLKLLASLTALSFLSIIT